MKTINSYFKLVFIGLSITLTSCEKERINLEKERISSVDNFKKNLTKRLIQQQRNNFIIIQRPIIKNTIIVLQLTQDNSTFYLLLKSLS